MATRVITIMFTAAEPEVRALVWEQFDRHYPGGSGAQHCAAFIKEYFWEAAQPWLLEKLRSATQEYPKLNAFRILDERGVLEEVDRFRFQQWAALQDDDDYQDPARAYFAGLRAAGRFSELHRQAGPLALDAAPALGYPDSREAVLARSIIAEFFLEDALPALHAWLAQPLPPERWGEDDRSHNAWIILEATAHLEGVPLAAYHLRNLRAPFYANAYDWLRGSVRWAGELSPADAHFAEAGEALAQARAWTEGRREHYRDDARNQVHYRAALEILEWIDAAQGLRQRD